MGWATVALLALIIGGWLTVKWRTYSRLKRASEALERIDGALAVAPLRDAGGCEYEAVIDADGRQVTLTKKSRSGAQNAVEIRSFSVKHSNTINSGNITAKIQEKQ